MCILPSSRRGASSDPNVHILGPRSPVHIHIRIRFDSLVGRTRPNHRPTVRQAYTAAAASRNEGGEEKLDSRPPFPSDPARVAQRLALLGRSSPKASIQHSTQLSKMKPNRRLLLFLDAFFVIAACMRWQYVYVDAQSRSCACGYVQGSARAQTQATIDRSQALVLLVCFEWQPLSLCMVCVGRCPPI